MNLFIVKRIETVCIENFQINTDWRTCLVPNSLLKFCKELLVCFKIRRRTICVSTGLQSIVPIRSYAQKLCTSVDLSDYEQRRCRCVILRLSSFFAFFYTLSSGRFFFFLVLCQILLIIESNEGIDQHRQA